jgi:thiamine biosynthesis lipoprotein
MALHRFTFRAMAAQNEVQVHATDARAAEAGAAAAIAEVARIEAKYSRYRPDSVVSRINAAAGAKPVEVDGETSMLLDYADACWRESGGLFDPTSGVLRRAWRFDEPRVPSVRELRPLLAQIGWERLERDGRQVRLSRAGMQLDFGGFGKEYAADRAAAVLREAGLESALVNLAGDLVITAPAPGGEPWRVGVRHPRREGGIATLEVSSGAIATSGDYERFVEVGGIRHCHLLDPRTGLPAYGLQSVTALAGTCLVAGSATTIAMLKDESQALQWLAGLGLRYLAVLRDGSVADATGNSASA